MSSQRQIHPDVTCDICNMCPIVGIRYKCGNCANFDICEACAVRLTLQPSLHDESHCFIRVVKPLAPGTSPVMEPLLPNLYASKAAPPLDPRLVEEIGSISKSTPGIIAAPPLVRIQNHSDLAPCINQFSARLLGALNGGVQNSAQNLFCSPLSIFMAVTMATNGAQSRTLGQMATALGFQPTELRRVNAAIQAFTSKLGSTARLQGVTCELANSIWTAPHLAPRVKPGFRQIMQRVFQSDAFPLPSTPGPVNQWIEGKTQGKIRDMLDGIDPSSLMLLINAVYFKGNWQIPFKPYRTRLGPFRSFDQRANVQTMSCTDEFGYLETPEYQCCDLPYGRSGEFTATIVLPKNENGVDALIAQNVLASQQITGWKRVSKGTIFLPRFKVTWGTALCNGALQQLGMQEAFTPTADFHAMAEYSAPEYVCISRVLHKAFVEVNEQGTEAAAATIVEQCLCGCAPGQQKENPWTMRCDHPFMFLIRMGSMVLFAGRIATIQ